MKGHEHVAFTVRFPEKEAYILAKLVSALGVTPEEHIHDCVTGLFTSDIDSSFGIGTVMYKELHKLNDELREITAS